MGYKYKVFGIGIEEITPLQFQNLDEAENYFDSVCMKLLCNVKSKEKRIFKKQYFKIDGFNTIKNRAIKSNKTNPFYDNILLVEEVEI